MYSYPGEVSWAFSPPFGSGSVNSASFDSKGNMLFTGGITTSSVAFTVGGPTFAGDPDGDSDVFAAKYDPSGTLIWGMLFPSPMRQVGHGIAGDANGNTFVTGSFSGTINLGGASGTLTATQPGGDAGPTNNADIYLARLDASGNTAWSQRFGDSEDQWGVAVAVDSQGNVVLAAAGSGAVDFGGGVFKGYAQSPGNGIYVAKFTSDGAPVWSWKFPFDYVCGTSFYLTHCAPVGLAVDASDNVILAAGTTSDVGLGGTGGQKFEASLGGSDIAVWKLDKDGNHVWDRLIGGDDPAVATNADQWANAVAVDPTGGILVGGGFKTSARFGKAAGSHVITGSSADPEGYVAKLTAGGDPLWEHPLNDVGEQEVTGIGADALGNVTIGGFMANDPMGFGVDFSDGMKLAGLTADAGGDDSPDVFIARYDPQGKLHWARRINAVFDQFAMSLGVDRSTVPGNAVIGGWFFGSIPFGAGQWKLLSGGGFGAFMAEYGP